MQRFIGLLPWILCLFTGMTTTVYGDWQADVDAYLATDASADQEPLLDRIIDSGVSCKHLAAYLRNHISEPDETENGFVERTIPCSDGVDRPYIVYRPDTWNPASPVPLLVIIHGGVGRADLIEDRLEYAENHEMMEMVKHEGWMALFPYGQEGAVWWDDVGMANILSQIRAVKRQYNIDDNRVWMAGFSDGASASFMFAMVKPNDFGAFVPLNGHMGVAALDGELTTCAVNMANTPIHAICTDADGLYPAAKMRPTIAMALAAGADILYREYNGFGHEFGYAPEELPVIGRFLNTHPRNPLPNHVICESADAEFGWMRWLRIEEIAPGTRADWHIDHNTPLVDDRITFGFYIDDAHEGSGIKVKNLAEGPVFAREAGLQTGDIIVECDHRPIRSDDDLRAAKQSLKRGDSVQLTVLRDGDQVTLTGNLPPETHYLLFPRRQPTGAIKARYLANTFEIQQSQIKRFSIFIHPDMVQADQPVRVIVDGREVFREPVPADPAFMLTTFHEHRDRELMYFNRLEIVLEPDISATYAFRGDRRRAGVNPLPPANP